MSKERVLVADDEPGVRDMCLRALAMAGYEVAGVPDAEQAVKRAQEETFDALLTDLKMPRMSGLDACRLLHAVRPDMAMIIMTGYGTMESAIEALGLGVSEFILKPFRPDELNRTVARALERQRLGRENARLNTLLPLLDLSRVFMTSVEHDSILEHVTRIAQAEMAADRVVIRLCGDHGCASSVAGHEIMEADPRQAYEALEVALVERLQHDREPLIVKREDFYALVPEVDLADVLSSHVAATPLIHNEQLLGGLVVSRIQDTAFTAADSEFLCVLAGQASAALDNARLFQEIQSAYKRLSELDHLKTEFINIASHELRTPLATLLAYATILDSEVTGESREYLEQVFDSAMQLKSIIDEMVSLQRIDTGESLIKVVDIDMAAILEALVAELRPLAASKRLDLRIGIMPATMPLRTDAQVLRLILGSLLSNAVKFTPEGGTIQITSQVEAQSLVVAIQDTGVGIPGDKLERIFERFYQVEHSMTREHGGIGLGLAIAREMVDLIDGRLWVESEVGEGSTFYLSLPLSD